MPPGRDAAPHQRRPASGNLRRGLRQRSTSVPPPASCDDTPSERPRLHPLPAAWDDGDLPRGASSSRTPTVATATTRALSHGRHIWYQRMRQHV